MFQKILIATDGTELGDKAVRVGLSLAKIHQAKASVVTVTDIWSAFEIAHDARQRKPDPIGKFEAAAADAAKTILDKADTIAKSQGVACRLIHIPDQHPADGIISAANDLGADLIVMSSHGRRGMNRVMLGSQANEVVSLSTRPVLIVR